MFKLFRDIHRKIKERHEGPFIPASIVSKFRRNKANGEASGQDQPRERDNRTNGVIRPAGVQSPTGSISSKFSRKRMTKAAKVSVAVFVFVLCASTPAAELAYLAFLFGRYGKGRRIVGRLVVRVKHAVHADR